MSVNGGPPERRPAISRNPSRAATRTSSTPKAKSPTSASGASASDGSAATDSSTRSESRWRNCPEPWPTSKGNFTSGTCSVSDSSRSPGTTGWSARRTYAPPRSRRSSKPAPLRLPAAEEGAEEGLRSAIRGGILPFDPGDSELRGRAADGGGRGRRCGGGSGGGDRGAARRGVLLARAEEAEGDGG